MTKGAAAVFKFSLHAGQSVSVKASVSLAKKVRCELTFLFR